MENLLELAERCEKAEGPSDTLDVELTLAVFPDSYPAPKLMRYTASLDAALTLVPEGYLWTAATYRAEEDAPPYYADCMSPETFSGAEWGEAFTGQANGPALGLCAAALRARATQGIEAGTGETREAGLDPKDESPIGVADAP